MQHWFEMAITVICSVFASSGFWAIIEKRRESKDAKTQMILGLGHDRVIYLCKSFLEQGYISVDDYANNIYIQKALVKDLDQARVEAIDMIINEPSITYFLK